MLRRRSRTIMNNPATLCRQAASVRMPSVTRDGSGQPEIREREAQEHTAAADPPARRHAADVCGRRMAIKDLLLCPDAPAAATVNLSARNERYTRWATSSGLLRPARPFSS